MSNENKQNKKVDQKTLIYTTTAVALAIGFIPEFSFAATDAFGDILTKANEWVGGSAGKLVTFTSLAIA
jgi:hypothetical protein